MASLFDRYSRPVLVNTTLKADLSSALDYEETAAEAAYLASLEEDGDSWHDRVQALTAELVHYAPNAPWDNLQRAAGEVIDGNITKAQAIERLTSKKVIIKK
jgi:hypothetical protein